MEHYGFFNGEQEYGQDEFSRYFNNIFQSGISADDDGILTYRVYSDEPNKVKVETGFAIIKGFYLYNDSLKTLNINKDSNYDRIDRIVIRLNLNNKVVSIERKQGTATSNPVPPDLQRDNLIWELSLAQVKIDKNNNIYIIDERFRQELCGAIRPKNFTEFNAMLKEFQKQFDLWFNSQQSKGWRNVFIQPDVPEGSVQGSIWIQTL